MHVKELKTCCTSLGVYKHFRWRSWLGALGGVRLGFLFSLWRRSWKNREKIKASWKIFYQGLKERPRISHMARVMGNTAHALQLGVIERVHGLARVPLVWENVRKSRSHICQHPELVYGLNHSHLSTLWLSSPFTYSPRKWLGTWASVDQFLWKIGHVKYSVQAYGTNKKQGEPDSSHLILLFPES